MNKKLFSWKALAGLALLVAMGLTSCKQGTEVDPTDPYNTTKPTQPGVISGEGDLTLKLAVPSDFASLWNSSVKDDVKKALAKKDEIKVVVKTSGMKLAEKASAATNTLTLPDFFNGATDKVVNLVFDGSFAETKSGLILNTTNLAGDVINVTLPGNADNAAYDLTTQAAATSVLSIASSTPSYFDHLNVTGGTGKLALKVGSGINVARIADGTGQVTIAGGNIETVETSGNQSTVGTWNWAGGINIGNGQQVYGVWAAKGSSIDVTTNNNYKKPLEGIIIDEAATVNLYGAGSWYDNWAANPNPYVKSIIGLGKISDATKASTLNVENGEFNLKNTSLVKNVIVTTPTYTYTYSYVDANNVTQTATATANYALTIDNDIFDGAIIDVPATIKAAQIGDVTFNNSTYVDVPSVESQFKFNNVNFATTSWLRANVNLTKAILDANDQQAYTLTYYYYDIENSVWKTTESLNDVPKANKNLDPEGATITNYETAADGNLWNNTMNAHYWFAFINFLEESVPTKDVKVVLDFTGCKVAGKAMTSENLATVASVQTYIKYRIDGILYAWKSTTSGNKLISVKE
jgi:hypothetical protein